MAPLVDLQQVVVRRVDRVLFEGLSLSISSGERVGVVGANGAGKSTLLRIVAGVETPQEGQVRRARGVRVGFLEQVPVLPPGRVRSAAGEGWEAAAALDRLGLGEVGEADVTTLSGGQAKRAALARVLAHPAELLVLDEPTNHLDLGAVSWLEQRLLSFGGGLVLVTHDRHLLDRVSTRMLELDRGRAYGHDGGYASYLEARAVREEHATSAEATRRNLARRELAWLRRGAKARTRKPQARIDAAVRLLEGGPAEAVGVTTLERSGATPRLGDKVIECRGVGFAYDNGPVVLSGVDLALGRNARLGVVGANGSGKSTLIDLLAGRRQPTAGTIEVGPTVVRGYYDQLGVTLDEGSRVQDVVAGPLRAAGSLADIELMKRFLFTGELPFARVGTLSGGERRRLQLLTVIAGRPNVLFLDEPTNDFDLDTLRILEDFLEDWPGTLVVVSHDRTFLERTTDRVVAVRPDGSVTEVSGGIAEWIAEVGRAEPRRAGALRSPIPPDSTAGAPRARAARRERSARGRLLREMEKRMDRLQCQRDNLSERLSGLTDYEEMRRLGTELADVQAGLTEAEESWLAEAEAAESGG